VGVKPPMTSLMKKIFTISFSLHYVPFPVSVSISAPTVPKHFPLKISGYATGDGQRLTKKLITNYLTKLLIIKLRPFKLK